MFLVLLQGMEIAAQTGSYGKAVCADQARSYSILPDEAGFYGCSSRSTTLPAGGSSML